VPSGPIVVGTFNKGELDTLSNVANYMINNPNSTFQMVFPDLSTMSMHPDAVQRSQDAIKESFILIERTLSSLGVDNSSNKRVTYGYGDDFRFIVNPNKEP
jgi:hypothetical protein